MVGEEKKQFQGGNGSPCCFKWMVQSPTSLITGTEIQRPSLLAFVRPPTRHCIERRDAKTSGLKGDMYGLKGGITWMSQEVGKWLAHGF